MRWGVSIHAPWEGCDSSLLTSAKSVLKFQFTHPGKGATWTSPSISMRLTCFNSRTLGRVRPQRDVVVPAVLGVSIHAPWEGCDTNQNNRIAMVKGFNSRTLGRVRRSGWSGR